MAQRRPRADVGHSTSTSLRWLVALCALLALATVGTAHARTGGEARLVVDGGLQFSGATLAPPGPALAVGLQGVSSRGVVAGARVGVAWLPGPVAVVSFDDDGAAAVGAWLDVRGFVGGTVAVNRDRRLRIQAEVGIPYVLPVRCHWGIGCYGGLKGPFVGARWTFLNEFRSRGLACGFTWSAHAHLLSMHYDVLLPVVPLLQVGIVVEVGRKGGGNRKE